MVAVLGGFWLSQVVASPTTTQHADRGANQGTPVAKTLKEAVGEVSEENPDPSSLAPLDPREVNIDALLKTATRLADCPEALGFLQDPEVASFYKQHFGYADDPEHTYFDECPTTAALREAYDSARARVASSEAR